MDPTPSLASLLRTALAAGCRSRRLSAGETLFRQGDPSRAIFVLDCGRVALQRGSEDGHELILHVAKPGETFAEAALFASAYHCDAEALAPSVVTELPALALRAALAQDQDLSDRVMAQLARQVMSLRTRLQIRNIRHARDRILAWLRLEAAGDPPRIHLDRPLKEVAAEIGLTHEALYRTLATLAAEGKIRREPHRIILTDGS